MQSTPQVNFQSLFTVAAQPALGAQARPQQSMQRLPQQMRAAAGATPTFAKNVTSFAPPHKYERVGSQISMSMGSMGNNSFNISSGKNNSFL